MKETRRITDWLCAFFFGIGLCAPVAAKPLANDPCFQRVYNHTLSGYHWQVFECNTTNSTPEVYYKTSLTTPKDGKLDSPVFTATPQVETSYQLIQPDLLLINFIDERNGEALLLRPIQRSASFSIARFPYLSGDEESLQVRRNASTLTFLPSQNRMRVELKPDGHLSLIR